MEKPKSNLSEVSYAGKIKKPFILKQIEHLMDVEYLSKQEAVKELIYLGAKAYAKKINEQI